MPDSTKSCRSCGTEKPLGDYYNRSDSKDGKFSECKECCKERHKKWLQTPKGREYRRKKERERYKRKRQDAKWVEKRRQKDRTWYERNRERKLAAVKEYQAKKKAEDAQIPKTGEPPRPPIGDAEG